MSTSQSEILVFLLIYFTLAGPAYLLLEWLAQRRLRRIVHRHAQQHNDIPMVHGPVGLRSERTRLSIVDLSTNTVLASIDWIPRPGNLIRLTQSGDRYVVTVADADDPDDPGTSILAWTPRPSSAHETTQ